MKRCYAALAVTCLMLPACGESWEQVQPRIAAQMEAIQSAFPADPAALPACPADADEDHLPLLYTTVLQLIADDYVEDDRGVPVLCASIDARKAIEVGNQFNPAGIRVADARELLAVRGFAVVRHASWTAPGQTGAGRVEGHIVLMDGAKPTCQIAYQAANSPTTSATVDQVDQELGIGPSGSTRERAWRSDLDGNLCRAVLDKLPNARRHTTRPNG